MQRRSLNPLRELALVWWLWRLFRRERVDLVHGFTIKSAVYGALAARLGGVPARVTAVAGMGYVFISDAPKARALRPLVRGLLRLTLGGRGARLILQNPDDVAFFERERLVRSEAIRLIPGSGVDCGRFSPMPGSEAFGALDRFRVLLPARLLWDKGLAEYVEASRLLQADGRVVDFLLSGEPDPGNPASVPENTVREWAESGWVHWLGHVDDMPALLRSVDAVVLPSYYGEGLPKSLIEAAACGLPLITTDMPGCREVVRDGVEGLLVPARDSRALAEAIARLQDDPELRAQLGRNARARTLAEYDERIVIERTLAVYRELLY
jgi:glycosyltransferase involved in cell wall biosynthesis